MLFAPLCSLVVLSARVRAQHKHKKNIFFFFSSELMSLSRSSLLSGVLSQKITTTNSKNVADWLLDVFFLIEEEPKQKIKNQTLIVIRVGCVSLFF